jgi:hypothetical protein
MDPGARYARIPSSMHEMPSAASPEALQKLRKIIELFALEPVRRPTAPILQLCQVLQPGGFSGPPKVTLSVTVFVRMCDFSPLARIRA